jgi:hypothetical protein
VVDSPQDCCEDELSNERHLLRRRPLRQLLHLWVWSIVIGVVSAFRQRTVSEQNLYPGVEEE